MQRIVLIAIITLVAAVVQVTAGRRGVCYMKYSKESGCRKIGIFAGNKISFEACCTSKGQGWSKRRKDRKICIPCVEEKIETSYWSSWGTWSQCSKTCGTGKVTRKRTCISSTNTTTDCTGRAIRVKNCKKPPCSVDGGWSPWSVWGPCSVTCGPGFKQQVRSCSNPKPQYGGKECRGSPENWKKCTLQDHCPIHGGWGEWSPWRSCSKTCDLGTKTRTRKCDSPKPKHGGKPCNPTEAIGKDYCREERCGKTSRGCKSYEDCASGSGSGWEMSSGSGSFGTSSGSSGEWSGSGVASGEGSSGDSADWARKSKPVDDEDFS